MTRGCRGALGESEGNVVKENDDEEITKIVVEHLLRKRLRLLLRLLAKLYFAVEV